MIASDLVLFIFQVNMATGDLGVLVIVSRVKDMRKVWNENKDKDKVLLNTVLHVSK